MGTCRREALNVPRGQRYELCRSVHAEQNAIIAASRDEMLGATLYLAGRDAKTGEVLSDCTPCALCRRFIINAGIVKVVCRISRDDCTVTDVEEWIKNDESLQLMG